MRRDIFVFAGLILTLILLGLFFFRSPEANRLAYAPVELDGGSITVEDQALPQVVILDAELVAPGWITIHATMGEAPAEIIGTSRYLDVGTYDDLLIQLTVPMDASFRYIALLHADNGDTVFVAQDDLPVSVNGAVVRPSFVHRPDAPASESEE